MSTEAAAGAKDKLSLPALTAMVVGSMVGEWRSIQEIIALTFIDDALCGRGTAFIRQGALGALAFALNKCAEHGRPLRAGDVISTGAITGVHDIKAGQRSRLAPCAGRLGRPARPAAQRAREGRAGALLPAGARAAGRRGRRRRRAR